MVCQLTLPVICCKDQFEHALFSLQKQEEEKAARAAQAEALQKVCKESLGKLTQRNFEGVSENGVWESYIFLANRLTLYVMKLLA